MMLHLLLKNITQSYDGKTVLQDCSFAFSRRGVYVLRGPNGSGKSTLLRIAALIEPPERGEVCYFSGDEALPNDIPLRRRVTLVLPKIGLFNTTVFENIVYGLKIRGIPKKERAEQAHAYLKSYGLLHKKNQNALTLSSGESQMLGMARAMVTKPDVLFLDEPTASVDERNGEKIEEIILDMKREGNPMVIMTTHDAGQAERLADYQLGLQEGIIL